MSYKRVLPRDLFNEANLLKLYGQVALHLHDQPIENVYLDHQDEDDTASEQGFDIDQCPATGSIYVVNLDLIIRGDRYTLTRPLNTREPWSLHAESMEDLDSDPIPVFDHEGRFSPEMYALLTGIPASE